MTGNTDVHQDDFAGPTEPAVLPEELVAVDAEVVRDLQDGAVKLAEEMGINPAPEPTKEERLRAALTAALKELAAERKEKARLTDEYGAITEKIEHILQVNGWAKRRDDARGLVMDQKFTVGDSEDEVRRLATEVWAAMDAKARAAKGAKKLGGASIAEYTVVEVDSHLVQDEHGNETLVSYLPEIKEWCLQHLTDLLVVDMKKLKKLAPEMKIPHVTIRQQPSGRIDKDLSTFLPGGANNPDKAPPF